MDAFQLVRNDHQHLERLFKRMERSLANGTPTQEVRSTLREVTRELSIHAAIEEQFLYPALRRAIPENGVLDAVEEHHAVKVILTELEGTPPADPRFAAKARLLVEEVRRHIGEEERELLPRLERTLEPEQSQELGIALANAKVISPTRPHPTAPEQPPGNLLLGPIIGALDRVRDAVRDGALGVLSFAGSAFRSTLILLRRFSVDAGQRGREAAGAVAATTRGAMEEVTDVGRRTVEQATGRGAEAARQLRASARDVRRVERSRRRAKRAR
jgi:hemerythrin-like domain-containing protein